MTCSDTPLPGYAIGALATASRNSFVDAALGLAAIVGAIAGPGAGLETLAGDLVHPGLNVFVAGGQSPAWHRLEELLLEPVAACQQMFRNLSHATTAERLDHLQFARTADRTTEVADQCEAGLFSSPGARVRYVGEARHLEVLRAPTFFLRSPERQTLAEAINETMDAAPFLHYGEELLDGLLAPRPGKETLQLGAQLASAIAGQDQHRERDKRVGPGRVETVRAHLLVTSTREQLRDALAGNVGSVQRILRNGLFLDPCGLTPTAARMEPQNIRWGYKSFYEAIKEVLDARRAGTGFQLALKPAASAALHEFTAEIQEWFTNVSPRLQPFFSGILSLPYRLQWAFLTTLARREADDWVLPFTRAVTREVLERQKQLLEELITGAEVSEHQRARGVMLQKLADGPRMFRDLLRRYAVQRRDVHQPVLNELVNEGLVRLREDGYLELSEAGRRAA